MCKQQRVEGETHVGQTTKVGFDARRRLIPGGIVYEDEGYSGDTLARLVEALLLLTFTSKPSAV
jgi:hypothetical protein